MIYRLIIIIISFGLIPQVWAQNSFIVPRVNELFANKAISNGNYYFKPTDFGYHLYNWNWKKRQSIYVSNSFDSINSKPLIGYQIRATAKGSYNIIGDKVYYTESLSGRRKLIAKFPILHNKVKYTLYEGITQSAEGFNILFDSLNESILIGVVPVFKYSLKGNIRGSQVPLSKTHLILELNSNGEVIDAIGTYDSILSNKNHRASMVFHFTLNQYTHQVIITQKASSIIQVYDLKTKTSNNYNLNITGVRGSIKNVATIYYKDSQEAMMKLLIETPSFGDVIYDKYTNRYYVLRTDSVQDSSWFVNGRLSIFNKVTSPANLKSNIKSCNAGSQQFFHQLKRYSNKPLFVQVYDLNFQFIDEYPLKMKSSARFVNTNKGGVIVSDPLVIKGLYEVVIP